MEAAAVKVLAAAFNSRWDRHYVAAKLRTDPLYAAIVSELQGSDLPLLDVGCGIGLLGFYLRANGFTAPIRGIDFDQRKIQVANQVAGGRANLSFSHCDVRSGLPPHSGNVCILDILQFIDTDEQNNLLEAAIERVAPGGKLVIRTPVGDASWRHAVTVAGDWLSKVTLWMRSAPRHYPTAQDLHRVLDAHGSVEIKPLWGRTPFNSYLIVVTR